MGLTFRLGGKALLEFSFAWSGDKGTQAYTTGNTNNAIGFGARAAGTVGLRGVFEPGTSPRSSTGGQVHPPAATIRIDRPLTLLEHRRHKGPVDGTVVPADGRESRE